MLSRLKKKKAFLPYLALLVTTTIWAAAGPVIKLTVEYIPPFTFLFYRFLIVCVLLLPLTINIAAKEKVDKKDWPEIILMSITGQTAIILIFWALKFTSALDAAIIAVFAPILVIAAGHYFYNEKMTNMAKLGIIISSFGMFVIVLEPIIANHRLLAQTELRVLGNILALLFQLSWPVYIILNKRLLGQRSKKVSQALDIIHVEENRRKHSPEFLMAISFYIALLSLIPFVFFERFGAFGLYPPFSAIFNKISLLGLFYMVVLSSIVAYFLFQWSLKYVEASETGYFTYLSPILTLPFAYWILKETPSKTAFFASAIIALGVFLAEKYKKEKGLLPI